MHLRARRRDSRSRVDVPPRRGHLHVDRRRRHQRRRVLGVAEHRLHATGAGALSSSRTTATRSRCRSRCRRRAATSRSWSSRSRNLEVMRCDGTDFLDSYRAIGEAVAYVRRERKPALVHAKVIRPYSHSLSDDERLYKTPEEREAEARRDPLARMRAFLLAERLATEAELEAIAGRRRSRGARGHRRARWRRRSRPPKRRAGTCSRPTSTRRRAAFETPEQPDGQARHDGRGDQPHAEGRDGAQPAHRRLRRGRRRRQPRGGARPRCPARAASSR